MSINITMPALSPTMEEGKLAKWHVKEGDSVASGDVIAEIETDKATMEVEAVDEGKIGKIVVPEGTDNVKVNAVIAVLLQDGESADAVAAPAATQAKAPSPPAGPSPTAGRGGPAVPSSPSPLVGEGGAKAPDEGAFTPPAPPAEARTSRRLKPRARPTALPATRPMAASSPRHWPGAWPRRPASMSAPSPAPARMVAW